MERVITSWMNGEPIEPNRRIWKCKGNKRSKKIQFILEVSQDGNNKSSLQIPIAQMGWIALHKYKWIDV